MFLIKMKYALSTGNFRVPQTLTFQARLSVNPFCDNKFHLHGSKNSHFCQNHFAQKRTEAWGDSEIAY